MDFCPNQKPLNALNTIAQYEGNALCYVLSVYQISPQFLSYQNYTNTTKHDSLVSKRLKNLLMAGLKGQVSLGC